MTGGVLHRLKYMSCDAMAITIKKTGHSQNSKRLEIRIGIQYSIAD